MKKAILVKLTAIMLICCTFAMLIMACNPSEDTYTVTVEQYNTTQGSVKLDKESYTSGEEATLTVTPKKCYEILKVIVDGEDVTSEFDVSGGTYKYKVTKNSTVSAQFKRVKWTLSINEYDQNKGSVSVTNNLTEFPLNSPVTIYVSAKEGYKYSSVTVNGTDVTNQVRANNGTYTFSISQNTVVAVNFAIKDKWTLKADSFQNYEGAVNFLPFKYEYNKNEEVTLSVEAYTGYELSSFTLNGTDITSQLTPEGTYTFNISSDTVVSAVFVPTVTYTVSVSGHVGNDDTEYADVTFSNDKDEYGTNEKTTIMVETNMGYELSTATINGVDVKSSFKKSGGSYQITITGNVDVVFTFAVEQKLVEATLATFEDEIDRKGKVLIDFWGDWCTVCTGTLAPQLERLVSEYNAGDSTAVGLNVKIVKVRVSGASETDRTAEYSILSRYSEYHNGTFPFVILLEDGEVVGSINGAYNEYSYFINWLKSPSFS